MLVFIYIYILYSFSKLRPLCVCVRLQLSLKNAVSLKKFSLFGTMWGHHKNSALSGFIQVEEKDYNPISCFLACFAML